MFRAVRLNATTYPVEPAERAEVERVGCEFIAIERHQTQEVVAAAAECDALLVVSAYVPAPVIERRTRCRVISRLGAGADRIDIGAAARCGLGGGDRPGFGANGHGWEPTGPAPG